MTSRNIHKKDSEKSNEVGYGNPPKHSQFKKGQSGNPKGRPKGSKNKLGGNLGKFNELLMNDANQTINATENGKAVTMTIAQTAIKSLGRKAAKGDTASARLYLSLIQEAERSDIDINENAVSNAVAYKKRESAYINACKSKGVSYEIPVPHPDHIHIDYDAMEVTISGPLDKKSFKKHKAIINRMVGLEVELGIEHKLDPAMELFEPDPWEEDRKLTIHILDTLYEKIPTDDPLYLELAPRFRRNWVDYWFYYESDPHIDEEELLNNNVKSAKDWTKPTFSHEALDNIAKSEIKRNEFNQYMREKLEELMGDAWHNRHKKKYHKTRDIELDKMRYEFHTGKFDPKNYDLNEYEEMLFQDEVFLEIYMSWLPDDQRGTNIEEYLDGLNDKLRSES